MTLGNMCHPSTHNKVEWPYYRDLSVSSSAVNELIGNDAVNEVIQFLDSTLFQYNMRGWHGMATDRMTTKLVHCRMVCAVLIVLF